MQTTAIAEPDELLSAASAGAENIWSRIGCRAVWAVFTLVALEALFSIPTLSIETARPGTGPLAYAVGLGVTLAVIYAVKLATSYFSRFASIVGQFDHKRWLLGTLILGLAIRVAWILLFPTPFQTDSRAYVGLAYKLYSVGEYSASGTFAYWPPGYPFFLFAHFKIFGAHTWVPIAANLWLYVATVLVVYALAKQLSINTAAPLAALLLTVWPNNVFMTGLASKENVLMFLLPLVVYLYLRSREAQRIEVRIGTSIGSGLILGMASLTQPSMQLMVAPIFVYELLVHRKRTGMATRLACLVLGMSIVITPWMWRNHRIFNQWIMTTNGGLNFYRANNPAATGGYVARGEYNLELFPESEWSPLGYRLGFEWIRNNPGKFLTLVGRKQLLFLGDDSSGAYETLRRGRESVSPSYALGKFLAQLFWFALWTLIVAGLRLAWRSDAGRESRYLLLMLTVLYLFTVHSIFESGGRYHTPVNAIFALLVALPLGASAMSANAARSGRAPIVV